MLKIINIINSILLLVSKINTTMENLHSEMANTSILIYILELSLECSKSMISRILQIFITSLILNFK